MRQQVGRYEITGLDVRDPWLDGMRGAPRFLDILRQSEARHREARAAFVVAGGDTVLGLPAAV